MNVDAVSPDSPNPSRKPNCWQFSLRQMFAAITGVAILLGWAAWNGWGKSDAVVYLSIAVLAGVFSRVARQCLIGAGAILAALWVTGFGSAVIDALDYTTDYLAIIAGWRTLWSCILLVFCIALFLRANFRIGAWVLAASLVLIELSIAADMVYLDASYVGCYTLHGALGLTDTYDPGDRTQYAGLSWSVLVKHFPSQCAYIAIPWLLGIGIGEISVRRRKPSGGEQQRV